MRPGPLEIVLIIAVIIAVVIIARLFRSRRGPASSRQEPETSPSSETPEGRGASLLNRAGIFIIIAGIVTLIAVTSLFGWILRSFLGAFLVIAVGVILVFLARRRR